MPGVDFRVALVAEDEEAEAVGELLEPHKIVARGDRALRVGGRGDEHRDGTRQQRIVERIEIGQEPVGERGRQVDVLAAGGAGAGAIGGVERIRHQDRRPALAIADMARGGDGGEEQAFAAAVEHQHLGLGIDRAGQGKPARQPVRGRVAERLNALGQRIAAEIGDVLCQHRADEIGHRVLRFA